METTTHRLHEIGRPECVAAGCEPALPARPVDPPEYTEALRIARRLSGGTEPHPRAWAAAWRIVEDRV